MEPGTRARVSRFADEQPVPRVVFAAREVPGSRGYARATPRGPASRRAAPVGSFLPSIDGASSSSSRSSQVRQMWRRRGDQPPASGWSQWHTSDGRGSAQHASRGATEAMVEEERFKLLSTFSRDPGLVDSQATMLRLPSRITQRAGADAPRIGLAELQPGYSTGNISPIALGAGDAAGGAGVGRVGDGAGPRGARSRSTSPAGQRSNPRPRAAATEVERVLHGNLRRNYKILAQQPLDNLDDDDLIGKAARLTGPRAPGHMFAKQAARSRKHLLLGRLQVEAAKRTFDHENPFPLVQSTGSASSVRKAIPVLLNKIMAGQGDALKEGVNRPLRSDARAVRRPASREDGAGVVSANARVRGRRPVTLEDMALAQLLKNGRATAMIAKMGILDGYGVVGQGSAMRKGGVPESGAEAYRIACAIQRIPSDGRVVEQDRRRHFHYPKPDKGGRKASIALAAFLRWRTLDERADAAGPVPGTSGADAMEGYTWGDVGLSRNKLCNAGLPVVIEAMEANRGTVHALDLSGNPLLGKPAIARLAASLAAPMALGTLKVLDLESCHFGDASFATLASTLAMTGISCLKMANNSLTANSVDALCLLLEDMRHLRRLDLSWNSFSFGDGAESTAAEKKTDHDAGMRLADAIRRDSFRLEFLSLSVNPVGDEMGAVLLAALTGAASLQELDMQQCGLAERSEAKLVEVLDAHVRGEATSSLRVLNLNENIMPIDHTLVAAAASHPTLEALGLKTDAARRVSEASEASEAFPPARPRRARSIMASNLPSIGGQAWRSPTVKSRRHPSQPLGLVVEVSEDAPKDVLDAMVPSYELTMETKSEGKTSVLIVKAKARHQAQPIRHTHIVD